MAKAKDENGKVPDELFRRVWGPVLNIDNWDEWVLAPGALNFTDAETWAKNRGSPEAVPLSSGQTLVRLRR
jgi:hypothetical protein